MVEFILYLKPPLSYAHSKGADIIYISLWWVLLGEEDIKTFLFSIWLLEIWNSSSLCLKESVIGPERQKHS